MNLKDYIKGDRRGKEANRLEREAMNDPFLQDALEGFDKVEGNHGEIIENLEKRITYVSHSRRTQRNWLFYGSVAASFLLVIGFSYYFLFVKDPNNSMLIAENKSSAAEQPEAYFEETGVPENQHEKRRTTPVKTTEKSTELLACAESDFFEYSDMVYAKTDNPAVNSLEEQKIVAITIEEEAVSQMDIQQFGRSDAKTKERQTNSTAAKSKPMTSQLATQEMAAKKSVQYEPNPATFGEKEFKEYCLKNADKNVCAEKGAKVKVTFFIDKAGKPSNIKYDSYSCDEAKKVMENLLNSSPVWTETNRKIKMTVEW